MNINNKKSIDINVFRHFFNDIKEENIINPINNKTLPIQEINDSFIFEFYNTTAILSNLFKQTLPNYNLSKKNIIFCATNNIFGKNLLSASKNLYNSYISIFYPQKETEKLYELMMTTSKSSNANIVALNGDINDCKNTVLELINKQSEIINNKNFSFSFIDELNPAVLIPRILYLFYIYLYLIENNYISNSDKINIFISNENENYIEAIKIAASLGLPINNIFLSPISDIENVKTTIKKVYSDNKYLIDPYTACSLLAVTNYKNQTNDKVKNIILSLTSPFTYARTVDEAIRNTTYDIVDDEYTFFEDLSLLAEIDIPKDFEDIYKKRIMHYDIINKEDAIMYITKLIGNIL